METILEVRRLKKSYGPISALREVDFTVSRGEIFALIGPNGAGKTTALRIVATILSPDGGQVLFEGNDTRSNPEKVRARISYLPEEAGAYKTLTGIGYLDFMAGFYARHSSDRKAFVERGVGIAGLGDRIKDRIGTYSKGMIRKVLLARALMTMPALAILDEPTSGLDVLNSLEVRDTIRNCVQSGVSILLSSHNMLEIDSLCDRVAILNHGRILELGDPLQLKVHYSANSLEELFRRLIT